MWKCFALKAMHDGYSMQIHHVASLLVTLFSVLLLHCVFFMFINYVHCTAAYERNKR